MRIANQPKLLSLFFAFSFLVSSAQPSKTFYNVKDFGAKGDGVAIDTKAINRSIEEAATAQGGTIYFPAGNYLSGSIHLRNSSKPSIE